MGQFRAVGFLGLVPQVVSGNGAKAEQLREQAPQALVGHIGSLSHSAENKGLNPFVGRQLAQNLVGCHRLSDGVSVVRRLICDGLELANNVRVLGEVQLKGGVFRGHMVVDLHVQPVLLDVHFAGGQNLHLCDLGADLYGVGHKAHVVEHIPDDCVVGVHAGFGQQPDPLGLVDLPLDKQLLNLHLVKGGPGADLRLCVERMDSCHYRQGCAVCQPQVLSFQILGLLVRKQSVAQVSGPRHRQRL